MPIDGVGAASVAWLDLTLTPTGADRSVTMDRVTDTVLLAPASGLDRAVRVTLDAASTPLTVSPCLRQLLKSAKRRTGRARASALSPVAAGRLRCGCTTPEGSAALS
jgi:hypothetical protein